MLRYIQLINKNSNKLLRNILYQDNTQLGHIQLAIINNTPIINNMVIIKKYRKQGFGTLLLQNTENELCDLGFNIVELNLWSLDRCFNNYSYFYKERGYSHKVNTCPYDLTYDDGENIYYNLNLKKNF